MAQDKILIPSKQEIKVRLWKALDELMDSPKPYIAIKAVETANKIFKP